MYGLSQHGIGLAVLIDRIITNLNWLSVYKVTRVNGKKVKIKHVHPELYEDCMVLHQKVHQEIIANNELSIAFTWAFAHKNCTSTKEATNKDKY